MSEHTPSTPDIEMRYIRFRQLEADIGADGVTPHQPGEFKRWYEAEIRRAKAEALREASDSIRLFVVLDDPNDVEHVEDCATAAAQGWLVGRANGIEEAGR